MLNQMLLYVAALACIVWGTAHILATRPVVALFGNLSHDNHWNIIMEWVAEGLTYIFLGLLVVAVTLAQGLGTWPGITVYRGVALMLLVMAGWTLMSGARASIIPNKVCPVVLSTAAILLLAASIL